MQNHFPQFQQFSVGQPMSVPCSFFPQHSPEQGFPQFLSFEQTLMPVYVPTKPMTDPYLLIPGRGSLSSQSSMSAMSDEGSIPMNNMPLQTVPNVNQHYQQFVFVPPPLSHSPSNLSTSSLQSQGSAGSLTQMCASMPSPNFTMPFNPNPATPPQYSPPQQSTTPSPTFLPMPPSPTQFAVPTPTQFGMPSPTQFGMPSPTHFCISSPNTQFVNPPSPIQMSSPAPPQFAQSPNMSLHYPVLIPQNQNFSQQNSFRSPQKHQNNPWRNLRGYTMPAHSRQNRACPSCPHCTNQVSLLPSKISVEAIEEVLDPRVELCMKLPEFFGEPKLDIHELVSYIPIFTDEPKDEILDYFKVPRTTRERDLADADLKVRLTDLFHRNFDFDVYKTIQEFHSIDIHEPYCCSVRREVRNCIIDTLLPFLRILSRSQEHNQQVLSIIFRFVGCAPMNEITEEKTLPFLWVGVQKESWDTCYEYTSVVSTFNYHLFRRKIKCN